MTFAPDLGFPEIPPERIAQTPLAERDAAKLLVLNRSRAIAHRRFRDLLELVAPGDLLVLNDVRVIPARVRGKKPTGGRVTLLLLARYPRAAEERWTALVQPRPRVGARVEFPDGLNGVIESEAEDGAYEVVFSRSLKDLLSNLGEVPLPPYIRRPQGDEPGDREYYQSVFARSLGLENIPDSNVESPATERDVAQRISSIAMPSSHLSSGAVGHSTVALPAGAVAAPTAGLHFTEELLDALRGRGVESLFVTLWVGWGTFRPVSAADYRQHRMLPEYYSVPPKTAAAWAKTRREGRRVWAVGTTVARTLESAWSDGYLRPGVGVANLFITPGYRFQAVDRLITNFHMPGHTPLLLAAAFAGTDLLRQSYAEALTRGYRFLSYGDAMAII